MRDIKIPPLQSVRLYPVLKNVDGLAGDAIRIANYLISTFPGQPVTLCGTGTSGAIIMTAVLLRLKEIREMDSFILIKKPNESTHRDNLMGNPGWGNVSNIVIVDDAVSTGKTIERIAKSLGEDRFNQKVVGVIAIDALSELGEEHLIELFPNIKFAT